MEEGNEELAIQLVQEAINKCKDLVTNLEQPQFLSSSNKIGWQIPLLISSGLIILVLFIVLFLNKPKFVFNKTKP